MDKKVLVVDDDHRTAHLVEAYLKKDGYRVAIASDGKEALSLARRIRPDLVILDWMLPEVDGLSVCRILREESKVAVIMLTARTTEEDKLLGLDMGADDYVTKPFSPKELLARVRAVLRRLDETDDSGQPELAVGDLTISVSRHEIVRDGQVISVTPTEFKLLEVLARNPGRVFSRAELVDRVLSMDFEGFERTIDVHVVNLRRKLEPDPSRPRYVKTVLGVGYKLEDSDGV
jgi:DNA-binding response OmpR family regulator